MDRKILYRCSSRAMGKKRKKTWILLVSLLIVTSIIFPFSKSVRASEPDWLIKLRKVKILKSTKTDIERIFDQPEVISIYNSAEKQAGGWSEEIEYKTIEGNLTVEYSVGKCAQTRSSFGYDAPKGTVAGLSFRPDKPVSYDQLEFDLKKFKYVSVSDMWETYIFSNDKIGVKMVVVDKKVEKFSLGLVSKQEKFRCNINTTKSND